MFCWTEQKFQPILDRSQAYQVTSLFPNKVFSKSRTSIKYSEKISNTRLNGADGWPGTGGDFKLLHRIRVVNFTDILQAHFPKIYFLNYNYKHKM